MFGSGVRVPPRYAFPLFSRPTYDLLRIRTRNNCAEASSFRERPSCNEHLWNGSCWPQSAVEARCWIYATTSASAVVASITRSECSSVPAWRACRPTPPSPPVPRLRTRCASALGQRNGRLDESCADPADILVVIAVQHRTVPIEPELRLI
jgi:hypothetical protein